MLLSMTGFGKATRLSGTKKITVEIKSLNSKQMDLAVRIPSIYRASELEIRQAVAKSLLRGKADLNIFVENTGGESGTKFNIEKISGYKNAISEMARQMSIPEPKEWFQVLMRLPDTLRADVPEDATEGDMMVLSEAVEEAVLGLNEFRAREGVKLQEFFKGRIDSIRKLLEQIPRYEKERVVKIKERIVDALQRIPQVEYDKGRLEQEMIFYIEKLDITEEKQRLTQHLDYFLETMSGEPGQGKKLGFISQEMGREINTLGSKSNQADMQILVVKMKDELEQIKEQVLNVL